jgi:hypothetical protein
MSGILGLTSTKTFEDNGFYSLNDRRRVFREFPNGAAPLTGLLSLMSEESTDNPKFGWFEKRYLPIRTQLAAGTNSPFSDSGSDTGYTTSHDFDAADVTRIRVADSSQFRVRQSVWLKGLPVSGGTKDLKGVVTAITSSTKIEIRVLEAQTGILCTNNLTTGGTAGPVGAYVIALGNSNAEGERASGSGRLVLPINPENYTQIFRTPFMLTGTAMKAPLKYDVKGPHQDKSKEHAVEHMVDIEQAILFGTRSKYVAAGDVDTEDGTGLPLTTLGGIMYYLQRWEAGDYGTVSVADDDADDKRIIRN